MNIDRETVLATIKYSATDEINNRLSYQGGEEYCVDVVISHMIKFDVSIDVAIGWLDEELSGN